MSQTPARRRRTARAAPSERTARPAEPIFRDLSRAECEAILARNSVGRLAFSFHDRVDIQPIGYAYADGRLFGRTSAGAKLVTLRHSPWTAFEVDETRGPLDWRSVVAHGTFHLLPEDGSPVELAVRAIAIARLRQVVPGTATDADPVPFRDVVFEVVVDTLTGREATTRG